MAAEEVFIIVDWTNGTVKQRFIGDEKYKMSVCIEEYKKQQPTHIYYIFKMQYSGNHEHKPNIVIFSDDGEFYD